ncbi:MAG TPA: hypothetical protein VG347_13575 [Verrucomicrobiae bacterium]|nr:hypothetical protein [Verrucomicrobiae bacterium]
MACYHPIRIQALISALTFFGVNGFYKAAFQPAGAGDFPVPSSYFPGKFFLPICGYLRPSAIKKVLRAQFSFFKNLQIPQQCATFRLPPVFPHTISIQ